MLAGIREILLISTPSDIPNFQKLLGDGQQFGISIHYKVQKSPDGLAQAFILGEEFIHGEPCAMVLGDNVFYGSGFSSLLQKAVNNSFNGRSTIFGYYVNDPKRFGIVEFDKRGKVLSLEEKPEKPKSNYCVTGLYFYPGDVCSRAQKIKPSPRGELEITSLNNSYLCDGLLDAALLGRGYAWFDAGTMDSLMKVAEFVKMIEEAQGTLISVPEEIAFRNGWISREVLINAAKRYGSSSYGRQLEIVASGKIFSSFGSDPNIDD
jgi:glucose-1-phosphate thymidylyltransferase